MGLLLPMLIGLFALPVYGLNRAFFLCFEIGFGTRVAVAALILYFPILIAALVGLRTMDPPCWRLPSWMARARGVF